MGGRSRYRSGQSLAVMSGWSNDIPIAEAELTRCPDLSPMIPLIYSSTRDMVNVLTSSAMAGWDRDSSKPSTCPRPFKDGTDIVMHKDQDASDGCPDAVMAVISGACIHTVVLLVLTHALARLEPLIVGGYHHHGPNASGPRPSSSVAVLFLSPTCTVASDLHTYIGTYHTHKR